MGFFSHLPGQPLSGPDDAKSSVSDDAASFFVRTWLFWRFSAKSIYVCSALVSPSSESHARSPPSYADPPDARLPPQEAGLDLPDPRRLACVLQASLRQAVVSLPPRRTPAYRPASHLQARRQDALCLCSQRPAHGSTLVDRRTSTSQTAAQGNPSAQRGSGPQPHAAPETQGGKTLSVGEALVQTVRHFFPDFNAWLDRLPDSRDQDLITYERRFLVWWGIALYLFQLGSRRQLDFELEAVGTYVLANLNRLAETDHDTRPVHDTLDYYLEHSRAHALGDLRLQLVRRLLRMKALDSARLLGRAVLLLDATGLLCWQRRHCPECLVQHHEHTTLYLHQVLEAKLLGPAGVVVSVGSEFIVNADAEAAQGKSADGASRTAS